MIRKNKNSLRPLYREIVPVSLKHAWHDRWLWPFAIITSLLATGGIYDTIFMTMRQVRLLGGVGAPLASGGNGWPLPIEEAYLKITGAAGLLPAIGTVQSVIYALLFIAALLGLSLICQGALAYGIANRTRGRVPSFNECLTAGSRVLWKVLVLNVITLGLLWLGKILMILPWREAASGASAGSLIWFVLASLVYIAAAVALTAIHFFALYAIVVNDAHVTEAFETGVYMLKRSWVAVLELSLILFVFGAAILAVAFLAFVMAGIPVMLLIMAAALLGQNWLVNVGWFIGSVLFFMIALSAGAFGVTFQFGAWYHLGARLGEGGILAKVHRWIHAFLNPRSA